MTVPRLHIDLEALGRNFQLLRKRESFTMPAHRCGAVVKADAYGLGVEAIAGRLWQEGCRHFFVAVVEEGRDLRRLLPDAYIYVLAGVTPPTVEVLVSERLIPVLNSPQQCALWSYEHAAVSCALHLDTGMHRLGLPWNFDIATLPPLRVDLVMTHFARADEWSHAMRAQQEQRFAESVASLNKFFPDALLSLNNSAGALADKFTLSKKQLSWTHRILDRLGIGLYGANPHVESDSAPAGQPLETVATLQGQVLQVRRVEPGAEVGYGSTYKVSSSGRLATIGAGYADGLPRLLSNVGRVSFAGQSLPIVGRVSMDSLVVELADATAYDCNLQEGDWVELFGANVSVDEVARHAQTIAYEVFTGLGSRVNRLS